MAGLGVFDYVVQSFLGNAIEGDAHLGWKWIMAICSNCNDHARSPNKRVIWCDAISDLIKYPPYRVRFSPLLRLADQDHQGHVIILLRIAHEFAHL